ncbi:type I restriction-modification protein subunit M [Bifidobacterium sp. UTCIF-37]|uniref:type I restriction-modification system subunit M n=1 Tax=unclassified Bifidobacterium TaxID=2608897 RepID=UPI001126AD05|nr:MULTISPECIES: type I restriction-modification system subunit M [unclassified Bifidobacterium]TPF85422.1 type I restriction-modification protein subunit M [Bifidobacterium sp. UTCIF-37]TPF87117.1 type I restriction-modification protein subunit M [Bifidobacterium sp. UTCIF-38]
MNKQQLASRIWESANRMRSKIEANEYKDYILGFIFYKFLSETLVTRLRADDWTDEDLPDLVEDDPELVRDVRNLCGYFISYNNLFTTWIDKGADFEIADVRTALSAFERNINPAHKRVFAGIFDTLQTGLSKLGTDERSRSKAARDLIYLIKDIPMDSRQGYDTLGYIYEYLIDKFASNAGKKAGEFYTPGEVSQLMSEIVAWHLRGRKEITIYDPTSGSGSLLIHIGQAVARRNGNPNDIKYYAQELKENTYNLTRMNLVMRGILPDNIVARNGDTLKSDWPWFDTDETKDETYEPLFVDSVVSNPPYSQNWEPPEAGADLRFEYGIAPKSKADYAFLLHDLYHLRDDGIMCIVLPHGVLFRGGEEGAIRRNLVEHHHIQAIIGLPANIFFGTGIPTIVMVLRKHRDDDHVLIVDASKHFIKDGKNNKLRACDIRRIVDVVTSSKDVDKFSRLISVDEIRANDYNLNIPRYVDSSEPAESWDVYATMFGGVPSHEIDALQRFWDVFPSLKAQLFETGNGHIAKVSDGAVRETVYGNAEVKAYIDRYKRVFADYPMLLRRELVDDCTSVNVAAKEAELAGELFRRLADTPLVDPYAAYQVLDDGWQQVSIDLETIQNDGFDAVRAVDPNMVVKKKGGKDVEVQEGWTGRVLPFGLVQERLLSADLAEIESQEHRLTEIGQELSDLLENLDEEDKDSDAINEEGDAFVAAELKKEVKRIGKAPQTALDRVLVSANKLLDEERKIKKSVKDLRVALEDKTATVIRELDDTQVSDLLDAKWIDPLQCKLEALPVAVLDELVSKVTALDDKYATTYADVCGQIRIAESELGAMLDRLTGDEFDMAGIAELKSLLGGE